MQITFANGDWNMLKRALIALIITGVSLFAIDWASSAILCGLEQKLSTIRDYRFCPYSGGIIRSGFEMIADFTLVEWTALGTIATAVFAAILGSFTTSLARSARLAADAAKSSADAAVAAQRARFYFVEGENNFMDFVRFAASWSGPSELEGGAAKGIPSAKFSFKNYGNTPAVIQEICYGLVFSPEPFDFVYEPRKMMEHMIGAGGSTEVITCVAKEPLSIKETKDIRRGSAYLWLYGKIYYKDVFGCPQIHRFLRRFTRLNGQQYALRSHDHGDYNKST
jgi:hypothetical protein